MGLGGSWEGVSMIKWCDMRKYCTKSPYSCFNPPLNIEEGCEQAKINKQAYKEWIKTVTTDIKDNNHKTNQTKKETIRPRKKNIILAGLEEGRKTKEIVKEILQWYPEAKKGSVSSLICQWRKKQGEGYGRKDEGKKGVRKRSPMEQQKVSYIKSNNRSRKVGRPKGRRKNSKKNVVVRKKRH